jgi:translation initiation factor 2 subunit 3
MDYLNVMNEAKQNQPTINIGMIGHVSNGKSTITKCLSGKATQQHSDEKKKNITIKLGYANVKIFECMDCPKPERYQPFKSEDYVKNCNLCNKPMELARHISFVDTPGHNMLMATMLNGTCVMDCTILTEAANNPTIPAPQTREHLIATTITGTPNTLICLNKLDLVKRDVADDVVNKLRSYVKNTIASLSPIIPVAASMNINIDVLCQYLANLQIPARNLTKGCKMIVIRSFNVNHPGCQIKDLKGGVVGGSIVEGILKLGDEVILKPGYVSKIEYDKSKPLTKKEQKLAKRWQYTPLKTKIVSINSDNNSLKFAIPGGLIGAQLELDPALTADDGLIGNVLMPCTDFDNYSVYEDIAIDFEAIEELSNNYIVKQDDKVQINVNACNSSCTINKIVEEDGKTILILNLDTKPICVNIGDRVTLSSTKNGGMNIIGRGQIVDGKTSLLSTN